MWIKVTVLMTVLGDFSSPTPRESVLRGPWWGTVFIIMVMGINVDGQNMNRINRSTQQSNMPTWVMVRRVASLRPISTSNITINT